MIGTMKNVKLMNAAELAYARKDLGEAIKNQEEMVRNWGPNACPKLGQYWDEMGAVLGEIHRRAGKVR